MRTIVKHPTSLVITGGLYYQSGDAANNRYIKEILLIEQGYICCYTEIHLGRAVKSEIDHFNPILKDTHSDSYYNWYAVSGQWNNEKSSKWGRYQPVLQPTAADLETRIVYDDGDYLVNDPNDTEANNLYQLLNLGDPDLADQRKRYIVRMNEMISLSGKTAAEYFDDLMSKYHEGVYFIRALKEVFGYKHPNY